MLNLLRSPKTVAAPDFMPMLSRGKHFTPRVGACFMEFASQLAGERFSDHPVCTHPAVASLARLVNDCMSDTGRGTLLVLVPSVVGLTGTGLTGTGLTGKATAPLSRRADPEAALSIDQRIELLVGVRAAASALPIANEQRQRALAAGLLRCRAEVDRTTAGLAENESRGLRDLIDGALADAPGAALWARQQLEVLWGGSVKRMQRRAPLNFESITLLSAVSIAEACVPDADERLRLLLVAAIADTQPLLRPAGVPEAEVNAIHAAEDHGRYARTH